MAVPYHADAFKNTVVWDCPASALTQTFQGRPIHVEYLAGRIVVWLFALINVGAGTTVISLEIVRNPQAEAQILSPSPAYHVTAGQINPMFFFAFDDVPDGRDCSYGLLVNVQDGVGDSFVLSGSAIIAWALSG